MFRAVLDTNVLVAGVRSDQGASRILLLEAIGLVYPLIVSVPLMIEYESVLTRSEHLEASHLASDDIEKLLDAIAGIAEKIKLSYLWRPFLPDSHDDVVLETAVNGHADVLVTLNRRHFHSAVENFGIAILSPGEAVLQMRRMK